MNMNKKLIAVVAAGVIGAGGFAQTATAASGTANAVLVSPISFTEVTPLNFGTIENGLSAGSANVVVNPDGSTATTYGVGLAKVGSTDTRGVFTLSGGNSLAYTVSYVAGTITDGSTNMTVGTLNGISASTAAADAGTLDGTGADTFYVGGTLTVNSTNNAGSYTGSYTITAAYN